MVHGHCHPFYPFEVPVQLLAQLQSMLSHFVESHPAVVGPGYQYLQCLHGVHAADIRLCL